MGLLSAIAGLVMPPPPPDPVARAALERIFEVVDPLLRPDAGLGHRLKKPVRHALEYCGDLVSSLPAAVDVGRHAFGRNPLVHALFASADDISWMLGSSEAVRDYLEQPGCWESDHFYTLLAARRQEKRQLGLALQGEIVHADVPQTVLYFSDHVLVEPSCDLETTRSRLRQAAFDSLLKSFRAHVEALRQERNSLAADRSLEQAHLAVREGQPGQTGIAVHTRHLAELEAHLRRVADSLLPEHLEEALASYLLVPEISLRLEPATFRVDRLGILAETAADADTLSFYELCARDRRRHLVILARIDREEARQAVEACRDRQRRFLII